MKKMITTLSLSLLVASFAFATNHNQKNNSMAPTQLDDLIRGEMSAVSAYNQVMEKVKDPSETQKLTAIRQNHMDAVSALKKMAPTDVKEDTKTVGPWGGFVKAYTGTAKLFGDKTALKSLLQGEEHGVDEYKEALADDNIHADVKQLIKNDLLPKQEKHIQTIKSYL